MTSPSPPGGQRRVDHDTAAFVVESLRRWWTNIGESRHRAATPLLITADCGRST